jgi:hypothetical protein
MQIRETITLAGQPFPKSLPKPASVIIDLFKNVGLKFEDMGRTLILNEFYSPDRICLVKKMVNENGLDLKINHSVWTEYGEEDYSSNPLWILLFPDILIDEIDFLRVCRSCNKKSLAIDINKKVPYVKTKKAIVTVNSQFTIVRKDIMTKMRDELTGAQFEPFDYKEEYFLLLSRCHLGELINSNSDFIGFEGKCEECNLPKYKIFFGPLCYSKFSWNGDDIVSGDFHNGQFFSPKAYDLLKSEEKEVTKSGVVIMK